MWRAHDELLHRDVALKRVRLGPELDGERALREAHACARLAHPAIVALFEAAMVDGDFFLISELVEGETLARLIDEDALADEEVTEIGIALAGALRHAHARGVVHRDIKPQNVLVPARPQEPSGAAKLTDFGGASLLDADDLTRTGDVLGTLAYMAPEQSEGREVGPEADLYSLALVLYEALSGVNPVRGPNPAATARRIGARVPPLRRARRDLPPELTAAIDRALERDAGRRGSLEELALALAGTSAPSDTLRRPPAPPPTARATDAGPIASPEPPPLRRLPRLPPGAAGTAAAPAEESPPTTRRLAFPRAVWIGGAAAAVLWQAVSGRPGVALVLAAALAPLVLLPRRAGPSWLLCLLAPALGLVGLAGAFPAIAGQPRRWRERAALAALGYWWIALAEPLLGRRLWLGAAGGVPARAGWEGSVTAAAAHVVWPLLGVALLTGAILWSAAAILLPFLVRGRNAAVDIVGAVIWSAALAAFTPAVDAGLARAGLHAEPRGLVLGAVFGGVLAVAIRALAGPVEILWCVAWLAARRRSRADRPGPPIDEPAQERRVHDREPRRGHLRQGLPYRGPPDGTGAEARPRDGLPPHRLRLPGLRPERVLGLALQAGPRTL